MTGYTLKLIAMITMLIDHITAIFIAVDSPLYLVGRSIGRLSFPIFCFLITEGLLYTRNIKKYLLRLFIFAIISEIPFDLAFHNPALNKDHLYHQNIYFTLFIGLLTIATIDRIDKYLDTDDFINRGNKRSQWIGKMFSEYKILNVLTLLSGCMLAYFLFADYSFMGVLMIWAFYRFKHNGQKLTTAIILLNAMYGIPQILGAFSLVFINIYKGQRGKQANKFIFYGFYPIHLIILFIIKVLVN